MAALQLADRARSLRPDDRALRNTFGLAQLRNGKISDAVATLRPIMPEKPDRYAAFDLYMLSICYAKLGDKKQSRDCFDRAKTAQQNELAKNLPTRLQRDLDDLRNEADQALAAVKEPADPPNSCCVLED